MKAKVVAALAVLVALGIGFLLGNWWGREDSQGTIATFRHQLEFLQNQLDSYKSASESNAKWYELEKKRNQELERELKKRTEERDLAIRNLNAIFEELSKPQHSTKKVRPPKRRAF